MPQIKLERFLTRLNFSLRFISTKKTGVNYLKLAKLAILKAHNFTKCSQRKDRFLFFLN